MSLLIERKVLRARLSLLLLILGASCGAETSTSKKPEARAGKELLRPTPVAAPVTVGEQLVEGRQRPLEELLPRQVRHVLENAETFELMSVSPGILDPKQHPGAEAIVVDKFMKFRVIGKMRVADAAARRELIGALYSGIVSARTQNMCYYPRHAIRATRKGKTAELVICFQCWTYRGNGPDGQRLQGLITGGPQELFDKTLTAAGVPLR